MKPITIQKKHQPYLKRLFLLLWPFLVISGLIIAIAKGNLWSCITSALVIIIAFVRISSISRYYIVEARNKENSIEINYYDYNSKECLIIEKGSKCSAVLSNMNTKSTKLKLQIRYGNIELIQSEIFNWNREDIILLSSWLKKCNG